MGPYACSSRDLLALSLPLFLIPPPIHLCLLRCTSLSTRMTDLTHVTSRTWPDVAHVEPCSNADLMHVSLSTHA